MRKQTQDICNFILQRPEFTRLSSQLSPSRLRLSQLRLAPALMIAFCSLTISLASVRLYAESCETSSDMNDATRTSIAVAGQRYFNMIATGDVASLKQGSIPSLASDFSSIENLVKAHHNDLSGAKGTVEPSFLLDAEGTAPIARAEFFCGVFTGKGQTEGSAEFVLNNLPAGKYAVVILDATSPTAGSTVSLILQQVGTDWKMGGLYIRALKSAGHDTAWYVARAREYAGKGQAHNAWFYYLQARDLISPLPFMSTAATDKLYDESQKFQPADVPFEGKAQTLTAGSATYKLSAMFPEAVGNDLDLVVRYDVGDLNNTNQTYQSNIAVIKAVVAKYPEVKEAFAAVVARAVDPSGRDFGTLLAIKDIK